MEQLSFEKVGEEGLTWVRQCLENGGALAKSVLSALDLSAGSVLLVASKAEYYAAVREHHPLQHGVINQKMVDSSTSSNILLEKLQVLAKSDRNLTLLVEDNLRLSSDPSPVRALVDVKLFQVNDRFIVAKHIADIKGDSDLSSLLAQSSGYPLNAFVVPESSMPDDLMLNESHLKEVADSVQVIINSAYDRETYTIWLPQGDNAS